MHPAAKNPNVIDASCEPGRLETLKGLGERLDDCQKRLSDYLHTKRNAFPRFFFISDEELLSVLGSSDPTSIQVHLLKLFDNVKEFTFTRAGASGGAPASGSAAGGAALGAAGAASKAGGGVGAAAGRAISNLTSSEGESFALRDNSPVEGAVEHWMTRAEAEMQKSLHSITKEGVFSYATKDRLHWVNDQLGMVAVSGSQIWWTW